MRKQIAALLALLMLLAFALPAAAEETAKTAAVSGYAIAMEDAAELLGEEELAEVRAEMEPITEYCNVGFYTYWERTGKDVLAVAEEWAKGQFGSNADSTVFVIDMLDREIAIWSSDRVVDVLTTPKGRLIVSNVYKMATAGDYAGCAKEAFREMTVTLRGGKITSPMKTIGNILMAVIGAILLAYMLISTRMEQEVKVSLPMVATVTAGVGAAIVGKHLTKVVHHESSGGGRGGFGGGGGGGGGHVGGGSHGF